MATSDLIKLAPTLSAEERYKLMIAEHHRFMMGEKPLVSESEKQAVIRFDNRAVWEEYTQKLNMFHWAMTLWPKDIEVEKLRVLVWSLLLSHDLEKLLLDGDEPIPKEKRAKQFKQLKDCVAKFEEQSKDFYCYPEAIKKIESELYGVSLFNEKRKKEIARYYEAIDELIDQHNDMVHGVCENEIIKKTITPILRDIESYLINKPTPDAVVVERIVDEIRQTAEAETRMRGR